MSRTTLRGARLSLVDSRGQMRGRDEGCDKSQMCEAIRIRLYSIKQETCVSRDKARMLVVSTYVSARFPPRRCPVSSGRRLPNATTFAISDKLKALARVRARCGFIQGSYAPHRTWPSRAVQYWYKPKQERVRAAEAARSLASCVQWCSSSEEAPDRSRLRRHGLYAPTDLQATCAVSHLQ